MLKQMQSKTSVPSAWIVNPKDKGRKSLKNGKVFLNDGDQFEIELFNPLTNSVLASIKLNGNPISSSGLIIKPGQRVYLDCFTDDRKKFVFKTYNIDDSDEAKDAIKNNGLLEVYFYKEEIITIDNWKNYIKEYIIVRDYPRYPYWPYYVPTAYPANPYYYCTNNNCTYTANSNTLTNGSNTFLSNSSSTYTFDSYGTLNDSGAKSFNNSAINETGRVEKGEKSSQKFKEVKMEFEKNYISSTVIQILPESKRPISVSELSLKSKNNIEKNKISKQDKDEVIELIKKLADLHSAGILTDEEFAEKKKELLSKI